MSKRVPFSNPPVDDVYVEAMNILDADNTDPVDWQARALAAEAEREKLLADWRKALIRGSSYRRRAIALLQQINFWRERSKAVHWRLGEVAAERDKLRKLLTGAVENSLHHKACSGDDDCQCYLRRIDAALKEQA